MTTAVAPSLSIVPRIQLTAQQRACLEQIARRQTSPQRLVRRAKILLALATGATQCHVMRQLHLNRGTVQVWAGDGAPSPLSWSKWKLTGAVTKSSPR